MSDLTKYIRENFPDDEPTDPKLFLLCEEVEVLEAENKLLADAYDIKSVPCSKCGAETGSLGRRITYLIAQNNSFRKQLEKA